MARRSLLVYGHFRKNEATVLFCKAIGTALTPVLQGKKNGPCVNSGSCGARSWPVVVDWAVMDGRGRLVSHGFREITQSESESLLSGGPKKQRTPERTGSFY